jgi:hypothetical protein
MHMKLARLVCAVLSLSVIDCTRVDQMMSTGSGGAGGFGGAGRSDGGQGGQPHLELCGIAVTCHDGILQGLYGNSCASFTGICPLGCRVSSAGTGDLSLDPMQFAQTLCISPADAGDAVGDDGAADGGGDAGDVG